MSARRRTAERVISPRSAGLVQLTGIQHFAETRADVRVLRPNKAQGDVLGERPGIGLHQVRVAVGHEENDVEGAVSARLGAEARNVARYEPQAAADIGTLGAYSFGPRNEVTNPLDLGNGIQDIALLVNQAPLTRRGGKERGHRRKQASMSVGDEQIDVAHATRAQILQQATPAILVFLGASAKGQHFSASFQIDSQGG